ncbi:MAG: BBP7 family outer membrane beta-barrel protein [Thermoguttaceae bacterium]
MMPRLLAFAIPLALGFAAADAQDAPWQQPPGCPGYRPPDRLTWRQAVPIESMPAESPKKPAVRVLSPPPGGTTRLTAVDEDSSAATAQYPPETAPGPGHRDASPSAPQAGRLGGPGPDGAYGPPDGNGYDCQDCPPFGNCSQSCPSGQVWFQADYLMWWTKGAQTPPLLTTSLDGTPKPQQGVLGLPTTTVLVGDEDLNRGLRNGGRGDLGFWLGQDQNIGVEWGYLGIGKSLQQFDRGSLGSPILARPFYNVDHRDPTTGLYDGGANDAFVLANSGSTGTFHAAASNAVQGTDLMLRWALARAPACRIDLLAGYRYLRMDDDLNILATSTLTAAGAQITQADDFNARNYFNGAELGMKIDQRWGRWSLESSLKLGLGDTHTRVAINGSAVVTSGGTSTPYAGGLLTLPSNINVYNSDRLSVLPELGITLGYELTTRLRATAGYTFLYWSGVARPGDQIDLDISGDRVPPPSGTNASRPVFALHTTDFWAQGLNFGLDYRF